jgi:ribosome maturation factor RimP
VRFSRAQHAQGKMATLRVQIAERVSELVEPALAELGFELVDIEYFATHGRWLLRLYIDKTGGVTIDDCARVSRELGPLIDVKDVITHKYTLEVSSPGVDRPLKKETDFVGAIGEKIKVRMVKPSTGRRNYTGVLRKLDEGMLHLETDGGIVSLLRSDIEKANLVYEFDR